MLTLFVITNKTGLSQSGFEFCKNSDIIAYFNLTCFIHNQDFQGNFFGESGDIVIGKHTQGAQDDMSPSEIGFVGGVIKFI